MPPLAGSASPSRSLPLLARASRQSKTGRTQWFSTNFNRIRIPPGRAYSPSVAVLLIPAFVALLVVSVDVWVLTDARRWAQAGSPVVFRFGSLSIATPESWALACLVLFVFFLPIYAVARRS